MNRPFPWKCGVCREKAAVPKTLDTYFTDGITLRNFEVVQCSKCGNLILCNDALQRITKAINEKGLENA